MQLWGSRDELYLCVAGPRSGYIIKKRRLLEPQKRLSLPREGKFWQLRYTQWTPKGCLSLNLTNGKECISGYPIAYICISVCACSLIYSSNAFQTAATALPLALKWKGPCRRGIHLQLHQLQRLSKLEHLLTLISGLSCLAMTCRRQPQCQQKGAEEQTEKKSLLMQAAAARKRKPEESESQQLMKEEQELLKNITRQKALKRCQGAC